MSHKATCDYAQNSKKKKKLSIKQSVIKERENKKVISKRKKVYQSTVLTGNMNIFVMTDQNSGGSSNAHLCGFHKLRYPKTISPNFLIAFSQNLFCFSELIYYWDSSSRSPSPQEAPLQLHSDGDFPGSCSLWKYQAH